MKTILEGNAFTFGKNLDTDQIYPGQYLELAQVEDIKQHALEGADPDFVRKFKPGDIIVAGTNFGCGSSREQAAIALKAIGTSVVLAESFARIFYRNAINLGLPLQVCPGITDHVTTGDTLKIDLKEGIVHNKSTGAEFKAQQMSGYVFEILEAGGIKPLVKKQLTQFISHRPVRI